MSNIEDKKVTSSTPVDLKDPDKPILDKLGELMQLEEEKLRFLEYG